MDANERELFCIQGNGGFRLGFSVGSMAGRVWTIW
jgi:hypothetical protein